MSGETRVGGRPDLPDHVQERDIRAYGPGSRGGSSTVFDIFEYHGKMLFKKYTIRRAEADLESLIQLPKQLDETAGTFLWSRFAWPVAVVTADDGSVGGVLVPRAEVAFRAHLSTGKVRVRDFNDLLYEERAARVGIRPTTLREKLALLLTLVESLVWLEERDLVHEDLSAGNTLWTVEPEPAVLLLDCDAVRPAGSDSDDPLLVTTDWTDPRVLSGEIPRPDGASVSYAVGLMAARVLGTPLWRPALTGQPEPPVHGVPDQLQSLLRDSVSSAVPRPLLTNWADALRSAIEAASSTSPVTSPPPAIGPLRRGGISYSTKERSVLVLGFVIGALAAVLFLMEML